MFDTIYMFQKCKNRKISQKPHYYFLTIWLNHDVFDCHTHYIYQRRMLNTIVLQVLVVLMASIRIRKYPTVTIQIKFTKLFSIIHVSWSSLDDLIQRHKPHSEFLVGFIIFAKILPICKGKYIDS